MVFSRLHAALYISSSNVTNIFWADPQSTDKESQSIREDRIQAIWTRSVSVHLPAPQLGLGHGGQAATATRGPQSPRHRSPEPVPPTPLGESQGGLRPAEPAHASRRGHLPAGSNSSHTRCTCTFSVHVSLSADAPHVFTNHTGVLVLRCCPNDSSALLCQSDSQFLRLWSRSIYSYMKMLWLRLDSCHVSLSVVYKLRLRARNLDLVGGHIALGEHFDPATKKKKKRDSTLVWRRRGGTGSCWAVSMKLGANWSSAETHLQSMEKYRITLPQMHEAKRWSRAKLSQTYCFASFVMNWLNS